MPAPNRPKVISVDFTDVTISGGGLRSDHIPEGDYLARVVDCQEFEVKDQKGVKRLVWSLEIVEPTKYAGKKVLNSTTLKKESLWALRAFLANMIGEERVPQSILKIPIEKIVTAKKQVGVTVEDDDYNPNKLKSKVTDTFPKSEWESRSQTASGDDIEEEEEDEEEVKEKATSSDDDEDMDDIDVEDI